MSAALEPWLLLADCRRGAGSWSSRALAKQSAQASCLRMPSAPAEPWRLTLRLDSLLNDGHSIVLALTPLLHLGTGVEADALKLRGLFLQAAVRRRGVGGGGMKRSAVAAAAGRHKPPDKELW